jgi:hypothetical protein
VHPLAATGANKPIKIIYGYWPPSFFMETRHARRHEAPHRKCFAAIALRIRGGFDRGFTHLRPIANQFLHGGGYAIAVGA